MVLRPDPSGESRAATATEPDRSRRLVRVHGWPHSSRRVGESAIRFVAVASVRDWALPAAFPSGRSRPVGSGPCGQDCARDAARRVEITPRPSGAGKLGRQPGREATRPKRRHRETPAPESPKRPVSTETGQDPPRQRQTVARCRGARAPARHAIRAEPKGLPSESGKGSLAFETPAFHVLGREAPAARRPHRRRRRRHGSTATMRRALPWRGVGGCGPLRGAAREARRHAPG